MTKATQDVLIFQKEQSALLGDCSHMWIKRREQSDPTFPKRIYIGRRPARWRSQLLAWIARQPQTRSTPQAENFRKRDAVQAAR